MALVTDVPRQWKSWRVLKSHYVKEKEQGRRTGKNGGNEGDLRATSIAAIQCMAHKSEINRMFIEQLCAAAISASMLPSSSTSRSNRSRRVIIVVYAPIVIVIFKRMKII